jgi:hypothetical protein
MRLRTHLVLAVIASLLIGVAACEPPPEDASQREQQRQGQNYEGLEQNQAARGMAWSPTRDSLNKWADTWEEQGKLSYVYLLDSVGHEIGYYIFEGLPVSYCASLTPPDKVVDVDKVVGGSSVDALSMQAPAIDGVYYSSANCQQLFGYDATSGAYMEFTGGGSFNYLLSDQPMTEIDTKPLGDATIEEVEK